MQAAQHGQCHSQRYPPAMRCEGMAMSTEYSPPAPRYSSSQGTPRPVRHRKICSRAGKLRRGLQAALQAGRT